jgi:hypothetical protein
MFRGLLALMAIAALAGRALAQSEVCNDAKQGYDKVQPQATDVAQKYFDCVRKFDPFNDCDAEFQQLRSSHEVFEIPLTSCKTSASSSERLREPITRQA